jgi:hypothetical protein
MTRFDAATPEDRQDLVADAIAAHRERDSPFCTVEADPAHADDLGLPWVQVGDDTINCDCSDAELDALGSLLDDYPDFQVADRASPEEAEGTNVRITTHSDPERIAGFVDRALQEVYGLPADAHVWITAV